MSLVNAPASSPSLIGRLRSPFIQKAMRYAGVSLVGVVTTQILLIIFHAVMHMGAQAANIAAVMIASVPTYVLNRSWVWGKTGRSHLRREVLPFWGFALAGLGLSTYFVGLVEQRTDATLPVLGANLAGFGVLWVARFFVLDRLLFPQTHESESLLEHIAEDAPLA